MKRVVLGALALLVVAASCERAVAADSAVRVVTPPPVVVTEAPPAEQVIPPYPPNSHLVPPYRTAPTTAYGCKRVWRCDAQVCEWRRGCWGIYGYMEGPYYTTSLARRQWERDGWPTPHSR